VLAFVGPYICLSVIFLVTTIDKNKFTYTHILLILGSFVALSSGVFAGLFLLTEKIIIRNQSLIRKTIFGEKIVDINCIQMIECHRFGRGNTVLKIQSNYKNMRMGWAFPTKTINEIVSEVMDLQASITTQHVKK